MASTIQCCCGASYAVEAHCRGTKVRCPRCNRTWTAEIEPSVKAAHQTASLGLTDGSTVFSSTAPVPRAETATGRRDRLIAHTCVVAFAVAIALIRHNADSGGPPSPVGTQPLAAAKARPTGAPHTPTLPGTVEEAFAYIAYIGQLSAAEQERQLPNLSDIFFNCFKRILATTKVEWDQQTIDQQTLRIRFLESAFEIYGVPKTDVQHLSLFLGPFMQSAPQHASIEDGVIQHFAIQRKIKNEQAAAGLMQFLNAVDVGVRVVNAFESN
jgi:hypothetical protein